MFYGAAQFSRDLDLAILADPDNLSRLREALRELKAEPVAVPPLEERWLHAGHAAHFRCKREDIANLRIDLMSKMRGVEDFDLLWSRRTTIETSGVQIDLLSLWALVQAKKTKRDKDWPMIRRLVERDFLESKDDPSPDQPAFWLLELRSPELLIEVSQRFPAIASELTIRRPLLKHAIQSDVDGLQSGLDAEEKTERASDREYWLPLRRQMEEIRRTRSRTSLH